MDLVKLAMEKKTAAGRCILRRGGGMRGCLLEKRITEEFDSVLFHQCQEWGDRYE